MIKKILILFFITLVSSSAIEESKIKSVMGVKIQKVTSILQKSRYQKNRKNKKL